MRAVEASGAQARLTSLTSLTGRAIALLAFAALGASCGSDNNTPTTPTTPTGRVTETLHGTLAPRGVAIRTFAAIDAGTVTVQLAQVDPSITVGLGVGIRAATGSECKFSQTVNTQAGTTAQLSVAVDPGVYCAGAYDIGNVGSLGAVVTVTVTHP
jgi:hypothetical protein